MSVNVIRKNGCRSQFLPASQFQRYADARCECEDVNERRKYTGEFNGIRLFGCVSPEAIMV